MFRRDNNVLKCSSARNLEKTALTESQIKSHKSVHATVFDDFVMMVFKLKFSNDEEVRANVGCLK